MRKIQYLTAFIVLTGASAMTAVAQDATHRGWHPNARANSNSASQGDMMTFPGTHHIDDISPRPILFVTGDIAHSRSMSEDAYSRAAEPKELYVAEGDVMHIDLYDDVTKIPFDKIESFFKTNLK